MKTLLARLAATTPGQADLALLALRLWCGLVMALAHGLGKVTDLETFAGKVQEKGFMLPAFLAAFAAASEFAGGLLVAAGFLMRLAAFTLVVTMLTAAFYVHADDPFGKKELAFSYGVPALALLLAGPGKYSFDRLLFRPKDRSP
jgi:putative oxidoreductase